MKLSPHKWFQHILLLLLQKEKKWTTFGIHFSRKLWFFNGCLTSSTYKIFIVFWHKRATKLKSLSLSFLKNPSCNLHLNCEVNGVLLLLFNCFLCAFQFVNGNRCFRSGRVTPQRGCSVAPSSRIIACLSLCKLQIILFCGRKALCKLCFHPRC